MNSKLFRLDSFDFIKGLLVSILTGGLTVLYGIFNSGGTPTETDYKAALGAGIAGGIAYLLKQFGTNSDGKIAKKEA